MKSEKKECEATIESMNLIAQHIKNSSVKNLILALYITC